MSSLYSIGLSSLFVSKYSLMVSSQNVANADNPFYTRRTVSANQIVSGDFGAGVKIIDINRMYDAVLTKNLTQSTSQLSSASTYSSNLKAFESLLGDNTANITSYFQQSYNQINTLNTNASSAPSRNAYLFQLNSLVEQFNQLSSQIDDSQRSSQAKVVQNVQSVNQILEQIAKINDDVVTVQSTSLGAEADLLDERDRLINNLAEYLNFEYEIGHYNTVNIKLANGTPLVTGDVSYSLTTFPSKQNTNLLDVGISQNGAIQSISPLLSGGAINGLLAYQENGLSSAERGLNRLALVFADSMNAQHQLGLDLNGHIGGLLLNDINTDELVAQRSLASSSNQGTGDISVYITDAKALKQSDYQLKFLDGTNFDLIRLSDNKIVNTGNVTSVPFSLQTAEGFNFSISRASFEAGDSFLISPTSGAASALKLQVTQASQLALAYPVVSSPSVTNLGRGSIDVTAMVNTSSFTIPGQMTPPLTIQFTSPTQFNVVNTQTGSLIESNIYYDATTGLSLFPTPSGFDPGFRVSLTGNIQAGDAFQLNLNVAGFDDNRNGLMLANLYQQKLLDGGSISYIEAYNTISQDISAKTAVAKKIETTQGILKTQAEQRRDEVSGVSLEEEAMNVARFQQTYQASAQILDTVTTMFEVVLNMLRR